MSWTKQENENNNRYEGEEVDDLFNSLYDRILKNSASDFVDSVKGFYDNTGFITDNQFNALQEILEQDDEREEPINSNYW